jgi:hypothetical protein
MKTYQSHKIVKAVKCDAIKYAENPVPEGMVGSLALIANDDSVYIVKDNFFARGEPKGAFYIVEYEDGYRSFSPAEAFEKGYYEICPDFTEEAVKLTGGFDFGTAIHAMKNGLKVQRRGWNGRGQFVFYVPANKYHAGGNKNGTLFGMFPDDMVPYDGYFALKTAQNTVVPWTISQNDATAEDWQVVA